MWHFSCKNLIPCLHWFLPKSLLWNLQYSGMFSVTVESHCQGKQNQKIPWQCDQTLCGNIPEYCKLHSSDLGKNQCKQGIKFLKLNCHSGIALAYLKRRSIVDSHHRPMFEIVVSNSKRRWAESFSVADIFPKGEKHKTVVGISVLISWYVVKLVFLAWNFFHTSVIKNNEHTVNPIINNHSKTLKNLFCEKIVILKINQIYFNNH